MKGPLSKSGIVASAVAALMAVGIVAAWVMFTGPMSNAQLETGGFVAAMPVSQPEPISFEDVSRIAREEIAAQKKRDAECREAWRNLLPKIVEGGRQRWDMALKCQADIDLMLMEVHDSIDAASFVESLGGWESTWESFGGWTSHENWMLAQFRACVVDEGVLAERITSRLQQLHADLSRFDTELLATLDPRSALNCDALEVPRADFEWLALQFRVMTPSWVDAFEDAWLETGINQVGGQLLSSVAQAMVPGLELGTVESGNSVGDLVKDFALDTAASEIVETIMGSSRGEYEEKIETWTKTQIHSLLSGSSGVGWLPKMHALVLAHEDGFAEALLATSGVDRDWAIASMIDYFNFLAQQENSNE